MRMGLESFLHVAMTVRDLDRSIAFYTDILGFTLEGRGLFAAPPAHLQKIFGRARTRVEMAHLVRPGLAIEMFSFLAPRTLARRDIEFRTVGLKHIAFFVNHFDRFVALLRRHRVRFQFRPFLLDPEARLKILYFQDPDET